MIIVMSSALTHAPSVIVHLRVTDEPATSPVTPLVDNVGVVIVATPLTTLHNPVPMIGIFPAKVAVVILQICWSVPAADAVTLLFTSKITSSVEAAHEPFEVVHRNVAVVPTTNPVTPLVERVGVVMVATPLTTLHTPEPIIGALPASVVDVMLHRLWSEPATAVVGRLSK